MDEKAQQTALGAAQADLQVALRGAVSLWASATTSESERRADLLRDKQRIVPSFFRHTGKLPSGVESADVQGWLRDLEGKGISAGTIYQHACLLSSFYSWAMKDPEVGQHVRRNPARLARPKAPKPYQTESVKALSDKEVGTLVSAIRRRAQSGDIVGKRDYALLLLYLTTGMRREEVISLRGGQVRIGEDAITLTGKVKGGDYVGREVRDSLLREALLDYLSSSGRLSALKTDSPLWTRHDRAGRPGAALSSHSFVKNLKRYIKGDTSALEAMTAKDYVFINSGGAVVPREMIISDLKSGRLKYHAHDLDDVRVRVYGQTAVVTARVALKATFDGQGISGTYRHTRVYADSGGKWRLVSAHATRVAQ